MTASFWHMSTMNDSSSAPDGLEGNTADWAEEAPFLDYPEIYAAVAIRMIAPPCILLPGCFGNIATIFVMRRLKDHNSSQHVFLTALGMTDLILLLFTLPVQWVNVLFLVNMNTFHISVCKLLSFMPYVSGGMSAWLVTCVTVQRTMAVLWPHRMRVMCTVRRTWIVVAVVALSVCAFYFHVLLGYELNEDNGCFAMAGTYEHFNHLIFSWMDLCCASFFPSVCLIVCDVILSVTLFQAVSSFSAAAGVQSRVNTANDIHRRRKTSLRTTVMVLAVSCAFLVLTLPTCIQIVWATHNIDDIDKDPHSEAKNFLFTTISRELWLANSAINFFLYCLTGAKFRKEFVSWIRCGALRFSAPSPQETAVVEASGRQRHQQPGNSRVLK